MKKSKRLPLKIIAAAAIAALGLTLGGCARTGEAIDPGQWGYTVEVTYDALGGIINERGVRNTNYLPESLLYMPAGTQGMMVQPIKDGYVLAGWYTNMTEVIASEEEADGKNADGQYVKYEFQAQDRWDFNIDRVSEDLTLYARWIRQGVADYVHAGTGEIVFSKNITAASPVQTLSPAILRLIDSDGATLVGYYEDAEMTEEYDFSQYEFIPLVPTDETVWNQLAEEFPQYFEPFEYVSPTPAAVETDALGEEVEVEQDLQTEDTSLLFLQQMGWNINTDDENVFNEIRTRKNEIYDEYVQGYLENTADTVVYLGYADGNVVMIDSPDDLNFSGQYGFLSENPEAIYILNADIDMEGHSFTMYEGVFSGEIQGNGYTISNISLPIRSAKIDFAEYKSGALFESIDGAMISDLTIADMSLGINLAPGIDAEAAPLAINAVNPSITNVAFNGLSITTGRGDNGMAQYRIGDSILNLEGGTIDNFTGSAIEIDSSEDAEIVRIFE